MEFLAIVLVGLVIAYVAVPKFRAVAQPYVDAVKARFTKK